MGLEEAKKAFDEIVEQMNDPAVIKEREAFAKRMRHISVEELFREFTI